MPVRKVFMDSASPFSATRLPWKVGTGPAARKMPPVRGGRNMRSGFRQRFMN
jgi:hypothetical protein